MKSVDLNKRYKRLSGVVSRDQTNERFIITESGESLARIESIGSPEPGKQKRIGFLVGQFVLPETDDQFGDDEILDMFENSK